ncbi:MAG: alpha-E domain-containing protein [Myxococcales bacterium]|nr:alpha-E domain-containing protein [Myxococcales bacterium]
MLSRVANSMYWIGRYIERAENVARFVDVNLHLVLDLSVEEKMQWGPLVWVTGDQDFFVERVGKTTRETVIEFLTFDRQYQNSIVSCVATARENARTVREVISTEMWECINDFYHFVTDASAREDALADPHAFFSRVKTFSHLFTGLCESTMSHGEGWHFCRMGGRIERADKTSRILDVKYFILLPGPDYVGTTYDNIQWAAMLKSASGLEMYRKRHRRITPLQAAAFLILDREFPRSIRNCLATASDSLEAILRSGTAARDTVVQRRLGRLQSELEFADIDEIFEAGLHEYLNDFQTKLNEVSAAIFEVFFAIRPIDGRASGTAQ